MSMLLTELLGLFKATGVMMKIEGKLFTLAKYPVPLLSITFLLGWVLRSQKLVFSVGIIYLRNFP